MAVLDGPLDAVIRNDLDGLLLTPGEPLRLRRSGRMVEIGTHRLDGGEISSLLAELTPEGGPPTTEIGSRWKFVYRRRRIDFEFSTALTPEGWSVAASPRVRRFRRPTSARKVDGEAAMLNILADCAGPSPDSREVIGSAPEPIPPALADVLARGLEKAADTEELGRRTHPRVPLRTEVKFEVECLIFSAQISDLSRGGAFVDTPNPLEVDTELRYEFVLPGDAVPLEGRARVAWQQPMVGMGIEFLSPPVVRGAASDEFVPQSCSG